MSRVTDAKQCMHMILAVQKKKHITRTRTTTPWPNMGIKLRCRILNIGTAALHFDVRNRNPLYGSSSKNNAA